MCQVIPFVFFEHKLVNWKILNIEINSRNSDFQIKKQFSKFPFFSKAGVGQWRLTFRVYSMRAKFKEILTFK